jgi:hypothetical protein
MEAMARSESFEEFYIGAVGRLIGQLFPATSMRPKRFPGGLHTGRRALVSVARL